MTDALLLFFLLALCVLAFGGWVLMSIRSVDLTRFQTRMIDHVFKQPDWDHRRRIFDELNHWSMWLQFWRSFDSFLPDDFWEPSS